MRDRILIYALFIFEIISHIRIASLNSRVRAIHDVTTAAIVSSDKSLDINMQDIFLLKSRVDTLDLKCDPERYIPPNAMTRKFRKK